MADFFRDWLHNLWITAAAVIGVGIFMLIFMKIFYPEALGILFLTGKLTIGMINVLKLWPIVVLAIIASAIPRRRRR